MADELAVKAIEQQLFADPAANVYAVLDGASIDGLPRVLHRHRPEQACLYPGEPKPDMAHVAPYLVRLEKDAEFTDWVLREGWGRHWGIFAASPADLRTVRRHLRSLLTVRTPTHQTVYFRYYDPRVLRVYLPTCDGKETQTVFGPILWYAMETEDPGAMARFWPAPAGPRQERIVLGAAVRSGAPA